MYGLRQKSVIGIFATDYYLNKEKYAIGATLNIELAASAYNIEESEREISVDGDAAIMYREAMNIDREYDEDGNLLPVTFFCDNLVAYLDHDESCPDDAEFISPIKECEDFVFMGKTFVKATISISHEPDEMYVPLYFKKEMLNKVEKECLYVGIYGCKDKYLIDYENSFKMYIL